VVIFESHDGWDPDLGEERRPLAKWLAISGEDIALDIELAISSLPHLANS
jgi:hypothetical protein